MLRDIPSNEAVSKPRGKVKKNGGDSDPTLLNDISFFVNQLEEGEYFEGWGWDHEIHDERAWGDESWAPEMDELFERASEAFLEGDRTVAARAYGLFLKAFHLNEEVETFCGPSDPEEMLETDIAEVKARYLRALYDISPPEERVSVFIRELEGLGYILESTEFPRYFRSMQTVERPQF